jgi:hypothetical protein
VCTLTWAELSPSVLASEQLFLAIANQDHGRTPAVRGRVYILDPLAELLFHMYDDRGLDIIATSTMSLIPLYKPFGGWIIHHGHQVQKAAAHRNIRNIGAPDVIGALDRNAAQPPMKDASG